MNFFNDFSGLETHEKLKIVGQLIGKIKKCNEADVYETMILLHDQGEKITIQRIADILNVSTRTIYRNMNLIKRKNY